MLGSASDATGSARQTLATGAAQNTNMRATVHADVEPFGDHIDWACV